MEDLVLRYGSAQQAAFMLSRLSLRNFPWHRDLRSLRLWPQSKVNCTTLHMVVSIGEAIDDLQPAPGHFHNSGSKG
jgi:hypothetical protein